MNDHIRISDPSTQPVLITGATGFIGGALARRLVELQRPVTCLVRRNAKLDDLRAAGVRLVFGDLTDQASVMQALVESEAGTVFHVAGLVRSLSRRQFTLVNGGGVEAVAAVCASRAQPPVLLVVSSIAAAGPVVGDAPPLVETVAPAPASDYGRSKLAGEAAASAWAGKVPITIVRPPIVFGPRDRAVLEMFRSISRVGLHVVPGWRVDHRYSLVHVDDLVEGLLLAAAKGERLPAAASRIGQGIYYTACEEQPTYTQLGEAIATALGRKRPVMLRIPRPLMRIIGFVGDGLSQIRRSPGWIGSDKITEALAGSLACSAAKARTQLGWKPAATLAQRLSETAKWYVEHRWL